MSTERVARIKAQLILAFPGAEIAVQDDSHLHAGHAGAATGRGHFSVRIIAATFNGMTPIARHRAVYAAVGSLMDTDIHALAIDAKAP